MQQDAASTLAYPQPQLFIDGQWLDTGSRKTEPVLNPATEAPLAQLPHATAQDLDNALQAAAQAFPLWRATAPAERSRILRKAADLLRERVDDVARTMTLEQGKPLREARLEVLASADTFDWYAEEGRRNYGRIVPGRSLQQRISVLHEPVGVCAAFAPWNFPSITPARKIAGALAAGCTLILKPAEETPATALALVKSLDDAGLPKGVLNAVFGVPSEVSSHLLDSPIVAKFSFTGSTAVGKMLAAGKYRNAGQICIAPTRFYVHAACYEAFLDAFVQQVQQLRPGSGLDEQSTMGPLANPRRLVAMEQLIAEALQRGAKLHTGGQRMQGPGYFWQPTVLSEVSEEARLMNEEPFGPLALINRVASVDEAILRANRLPFGLAAYAFTQNSATRNQLARQLQTGMLGINTLSISMPEAPFGGVKESGWGSECGIEGLQAYCDVKLVSED